ncbi:MAG: DNA-processing protein DprA [Candidatus Pacebacteria bacterium]|nr:DNA-processing protein DprA [Candidatus Paceibacterota bacterium]
MSIADQKFFNAFNLIPQMGPIRFAKICVHFPSLENAWQANLQDFQQAGIEFAIAEKIISQKRNISPDQEMEKLEKEEVKIITINDELYPTLLKEIPSAPAILYYKGQIQKDEISIAIVGSRKVSTYGMQVATKLSRDLAQNNITVISGMALGVDGVAHRECLKLGKRTVAVLGSGIDEKSIYPVNNRQIAKDIITNGAIISEYPIGTPPLKQHFPARNRIISGLSQGVLVIEAAQSSGALITAKFALEQNREVFAIPGSIFSKTSEGTNNLIRLGAKLVTKIEDITEELNLNSLQNFQQAKKIIPDNEEEALILKNLSPDQPAHIDQLAKTTKMNVTSLSGILTLMEIKGKIKNIGGMRYVVAS